jgi:signal transduction histidine kinase
VHFSRETTNTQAHRRLQPVHDAHTQEAVVTAGAELSSRRSSRLLTRPWRLLAVFGPATMLLLVGILTLLSIQRTRAARESARHVDALFTALDTLYTDLLDAETAQRGYVITGIPGYLGPYKRSTSQTDADVAAIRRLIKGSDATRVDSLQSLVTEKRAQLANTIAVRRDHGFDSAAIVVRTDSGKRTMDAIRAVLGEIVADEHRVSAQRIGLAERDAEITETVLGIGTVAAVVIALLLNAILARHATSEAAAARGLATQAQRLEAQQLALERQTRQLQEQAAQLTAANQILLATSANLQSEKGAREAALREAVAARQDAQRADATKTQFLTAMSHELRTPVNAIIGFVELLNLELAGPVTDAQRDHLNRIGKSGAHLRDLINDLLDLGRIEAGQLQFRLEQVPLFHIVHSVKEMVGRMYDAKGLTLDWPTVDRKLTIFADPARVQQILINVLTNAYKYTGTGGRVTVECTGPTASGGQRGGERLRESGSASIRISDTGCGIRAEDLATIFEPFVQLDRRAAQTTQRGVGLGLPIARTLARGMGGDLTVESVVGRGSTFTLTLPVEASPAAVVAGPLTPPARPEPHAA